jgi:hypothetical protein
VQAGCTAPCIDELPHPLAILWLAVEALLLWLASGFGDFSQPQHARIFVALMWSAGAAFGAAVFLQSREGKHSRALFWTAVVHCAS